MTVEQIKEWLLSKGVTLWASWDLSQPERLQEAAEWFYVQMRDLSHFVVKADPVLRDASWDVV